MKTFEEQYQAQFAPIAAKYPQGTEIFANGKVYKVSEYFGSGNRYGVVAIDRQGNEKDFYEESFEVVKYKVCGRCGGTGRYSWNQTHGSICYGCSGIGKNTLAPSGFKQTFKTVCTADLPKFGFKTGEKVKCEFVGFSKTGGTPLYHVEKTEGAAKGVSSLLRFVTIESNFAK